MNYLINICGFLIFLIPLCFLGCSDLAPERSREINFDKLPTDLKGCKFYKLIEKDFGVQLVVAKCNDGLMTSVTEIIENPLPTIVITK